MPPQLPKTWTLEEFGKYLSGSNRISNEEVLRRTGCDKRVMKMVNLGHVLRDEKYSLLAVNVKGRCKKRRALAGRK